MTDLEENVSVGNSKYWKNWRESKCYKLQVSVFSANIIIGAKSDLKPSQIDPYMVIYRGKDREQSKKKTRVLKRTTSPDWNECITFNDLEYTERVCFELKIPTFSILNPLLCHLSFTVQELLAISINDLHGSDYAFESDMVGLEATARLGFKFDTSLVGVETCTDESADVTMCVHDAFASFSFFSKAKFQDNRTTRERLPLPKIDSDDDTEYEDE